MRIFIHRGSRIFGPYSPSQINQALDLGTIHPTDLASRDGGNQQMPLSQLLGFTVGMRGQPVGQASQPKKRVGCCGWITLAGVGFLVFLVIYGLIEDAYEPDLHVQGTTGTITMNVIPTNTPHLVGQLIAKRVYEVAIKHHELEKLVVDVEFNPALLTDQYGHDVKGPLHMGTVTVTDLTEVRRYEIDGAYMGQYEDAFAEQVRRMNYAGNLGM